MPTLKNQKHEKFARAIAEGRNNGDSYEVAYGKKHAQSANRLRKNAKIAARISELAAKGEQSTVVTAEWLRERSIEIINRCMQISPVLNIHGEVIDGVYKFNAAGANQAIRTLAHMGGHLINVNKELPTNLAEEMEAARRRVLADGRKK